MPFAVCSGRIYGEGGGGQKLERGDALGRPDILSLSRGHYGAPFTAVTDASLADGFRGARTSKVTPMVPSVRAPSASLRGIRL